MSPNPLANTLNCHHHLLFLLLLSTTYCFTQVLAEFTEAPVDLNVTEGGPLSLNCTFTNADRIFWRKDGEEITLEDTNFRVTDLVSASATSTLSLSPSAEHTVHTGVYACVAIIEGGNESSTTFTITVQYLADVSISFRPFQCIEGDENPYIGSEVIIDCVAEGEPFPRVAWFFAARELGDSGYPNINFQQNKRVLNISSLQSNHSGLYFCRSENDLFPFKQSTQIDLGFQTPEAAGTAVTITNANPEDVIYATENGPATIDCVVSPPFPSINRVTFQYEDTSIVSTGEYRVLVKSCNSFSLIIQRITSPTRVGEYKCKLETSSHSDTVSVQIGTIVPVEVTASLPTVGVGQDVIFRCRGMGPRGDNDIPQNFIWIYERQGTEVRLLPIKNRLEIETNISALTSTLTLRTVMLSDGGTFTCKTSNPDQQSIQANDSVTLIVEDSPNIRVTPASSTVRVGAPLSLTCTMETTRNSTFSWFVNRINVNQLGDRYNILMTPPNQATLRISRLTFSDLGQIRCTGKDPIHLPVHAEASVIETEEPYIIGQDESGMNVNVTIQTNLMLNCTVRNTNGETLNIRWFLGNRQLNGGPEFRVDSSGTLIKNNVSLANEAKYLCRAELGASQVLEHTVNVMVTIPPTFTNTPPNPSEGVRGERFVLTCEASGRPTPMIFWSKMSQRVSELGDPLIQDPGNGSLIFEPLQSTHGGLYLCMIQGTGSMSSQTVLKVVDMKKDFMGVGVLNENESILVFAVVGLVAILFLIASVMVIAVLLSCCYMRRPQGKYNITKGDQLDGAFKRQASLRDNSGIHSSPSNHIFDTLQSPSSTTGYSSNPYSMGPATSMPLATYRGPVPLTVGSEELMGGGARGMTTNSMFSENINSHTSTPIHGTMASTSLFGSEEQTSVTTQLPNFPRANLQLGDVMGEGEFGPVVMGVATGIVPNEERTLVAVKAIAPRGVEAGEEGEEELNPEMALVDFANQMKLEFANIAMILGMCTDEEPYYVIYEYLNEGDLKKFLINSRPFDDDPPSLTPQHMQRIILQVADGMAYLFSQRIIHGDLASRNCLISSDLRVKIADLGIGHDLYNNDYYDNGSQLLPIRWMPPELLVNSDEGPTFSLHSDIWSFGVLCWEVFSYSRLPYDSLSDEDVLSMVPAGTRLRSPSKSCPPALYDIMMDCWHDIPEERPVFAKLCVAIIGCELD